MRNRRNFFFFFMMLVVTLWAFRYLSGVETTSSPVALSKLVTPPASQHALERIFTKFDWERQFCVGGNNPGEPLRGHLLADVDSQGNLYILDFEDLKIRKFSPRGEYLQMFGRGKGQRPGEIMSASDLRVSPSGEVWVADLTGKKIEVFSPDGRLQRSVQPDRPPYRLLPSDDQRFTLMMPPTSEHLFGRFGSGGKAETEFGKLVDDRLSGLALDGWMGSAASGEILYVPYYFGWIASYSSAGTLKYMVKTIEAVPGPAIRRSSNGVVRVDPDTRVSAKSASVSEGNLYILSGNAAGSRFSRLIDVYDSGSGAYRYSFEAPEGGAKVLVRGSSLYTVNNASVCRWSLRPAGGDLRATLTPPPAPSAAR
jgi:hypothetical protein